MLNRSTFLVLTGLCSSFSLGCDKAADELDDAVGAQAEANREISAASSEARDKAVNAQAEADGKIADAQANFMKLREDFRHETTNKLVELDRKIAELDAEAKKLSGSKKAELETKLAQIRILREGFSKDYAAVETASANTWDDTKVLMQKQWKQLEDAVGNAL